MFKGIPRIFLSHCLRDPEPKLLKEELERAGIKVTLDTTNLKTFDDIKKFMRSVEYHDCVILWIGKNYCKSINCMYEALLSKELGVKTFCINLCPKFYDTNSHVTIANYWMNKYNASKKKLDSFIIDSSDSAQIEVKHKLNQNHAIIEEILRGVPDFLSSVQFLKSPKPEEAAAAIIENIGYDPTWFDKKVKLEAGETSEMKSENMIPNELINWYFIDPINQRQEKCEYVLSNHFGQYIIDRWRLRATGKRVTAKVELVDQGLKCSCISRVDTESFTFSLNQQLEYPEIYGGQTITLSADISSISSKGASIQIICSEVGKKDLYYVTAAIEKIGILSLSANLPQNINGLWVSLIFANSEDGDKIGSFVTFRKVKLEINDISTLEQSIPPKKHQELIECQRFCHLLKSSDYFPAVQYTATTITFFIPSPLRITPTIVNPENRLLLKSENKVLSEFHIEAQKTSGGIYLRVHVPSSEYPNAILCVSKDTILDAEIY